MKNIDVQQLITQFPLVQSLIALEPVTWFNPKASTLAIGLPHVGLDGSDVAAQVRALTGGRGVDVVFDGVGKNSWESSLDSLKRRGLMISFGNASGAVSGVNLGILAQKGSLFVTRPTLAGYADTPSRLQSMADELFGMIASGQLQVEISNRYALKDAALAQTALSARQTTGSTILLP